MTDRQLIVAGVGNIRECPVPFANTRDARSIVAPTLASLDWLDDDRHILRAAASWGVTVLLDDHAHVFAVGRNGLAQLGRGHANNDNRDYRIPCPVIGLGNVRVVQISAGYAHCAVVAESGQMFTWGWTEFGQCGTGTTHGNVLVATRCAFGALADDVRVAFVACGGYHTVALTSDGGVIVFGGNGYGQLGTGNNDLQQTPMLLTCAALAGVRIVGCAAGHSFTILVSDEGRVFAMGYNRYGQLGLGHTNHVNTPHAINAAHFAGALIAAVACGMYHTLALTHEGKLFSCGQGERGATGLGHTTNTTTPQPTVGALASARVVRVISGIYHSLALTEDGRAFGFGEGGGAVRGTGSGAQLLQGALTGAAVGALGGGSCAEHSVFIAGTPPDVPGFDAPAAYPWLRRRLVLLCLRRAAGLQAQSSNTAILSVGSTSDCSLGNFLLKIWSTEPGLWRGPWREHPGETRAVATDDVTKHKLGSRVEGVCSAALLPPPAKQQFNGVVARVELAGAPAVGESAAGASVTAGLLHVLEDRWCSILEFL